MKASTLIGGILVIAGLVVLALRGIGYTREKNSVEVGPLKVSAEERGFIPPIAGVVLVVIGGVVLGAGRRRT